MTFFYMARYYYVSGDSLIGSIKKAARVVRRNHERR